MKPTVGEPSNEHRAVCLYSLEPGAPQCDAPADLHIAVQAPASKGYDLVGLLSCHCHASIARASAEPHGEHPLGLWCGLPGTRWYADGCQLDVADR